MGQESVDQEDDDAEDLVEAGDARGMSCVSLSGCNGRGSKADKTAAAASFLLL